MAFINEKVPENDWKLYNSFNLCYEDKRIVADKYKWWTVDRNKGIFFILLGGGAFESPESYILIWNSNKIKISITKECIKNEPSAFVVHCKIESIIAPITLKQKQEELLKILEEAFNCFMDCNFVIDHIARPNFVGEESGASK